MMHLHKLKSELISMNPKLNEIQKSYLDTNPGF